jgi:hypothetical protein
MGAGTRPVMADDESQDEDEEPGALDAVVAEAGTEAERLQRGRALSFFGNPLPVRTLIALAVFLVVFMAVWTALWATMGGAGLGLGWIPAAVLGALAVGVWGRTVWAD